MNERPNDLPGLTLEVEHRRTPRGGISLDQLKREIATAHKVTIAAVHVERGADRVSFFVGGREVYSVAL